MALNYLTDIDLNKNELQNVVIQNLGTDPSSGLQSGLLIYNSTSDQLKVYNGSSWIDVGGDVSNVIAGAGLTGGGTTGAVTLNVVGGTGITANANDISITNTITAAGPIGSATLVPVITYNAQGQLTTVATASISSTLTIDAGLVGAISGTADTSLLSDDLQILGTANEIVTSVTKPGSPGTDVRLVIGLPDDVTIGGDLTITGDLVINGDASTINTATLSVEDPLIVLASGNSSADSVDIGLYGLYDTSGTDKYSGLFRDASDGKWNLFKDLQTVPTTTVDKTATGYTVASLVANVEGNVTGQVSTLSNHFHKVELANSESSVSKNGNTYTVTHGLGTRDIIVQVARVDSPYDTVFVDVERLLTTTVKISFENAVTDGDYKVLIFRLA